jgi:hypothetical protein
MAYPPTTRLLLVGATLCGAVVVGVILVRRLPATPVASLPVSVAPAQGVKVTPHESIAAPVSTEANVVDRHREVIAFLDAAARLKTVWKNEIKLLVELEDLLFKSELSARVKEAILKKLANPDTGVDLAGLLTFVLTASPSDSSRKELASLLTKNKDSDAMIVHAVTIRKPRIDQDPERREAFWKGCLSLMEYDELLHVGFRDRLFREEYGRSLEEVKRREFVKPSGADRFDSQVMAPFHELQKKGFTTYIEEDDAVREALVKYLLSGESPQAKLIVCIASKPGPDLANAAREAFMNSSSYPDIPRRWLMGRATEGGVQGPWDTLYNLLPHAGELKLEMIERLARAEGVSPAQQEKTLGIVREEISRAALPANGLDNLLNALVRIRSESSERYLFELCREHPSEIVRERSAGNLSSGDLRSAGSDLHGRRIMCAEEAVLKDPSAAVQGAAATSLGVLLSEGGRISNPEEVRIRVRGLLAQGKIRERDAEVLLELLDRK